MNAPFGEPLFYHPALGEREAVLADAEARHVAAQRLRPGDAIALFDGRGGFARGRIAAVSRHAVHVHVLERGEAVETRPAFDVYSAVPKGDRQAVLLDMATQLGMHRFVPVAWTRGVVEPGARARERWRRICIEACKQSRRLHVPDIRAPIPLADAVAHARREGARLLLAHVSPEARPALGIPELRAPDAERYALFVGPEGGVTPEEVALLRAHGAGVIALSDAVLRVETAVAAVLALARGAWQAAGAGA